MLTLIVKTDNLKHARMKTRLKNDRKKYVAGRILINLESSLLPLLSFACVAV